MKVFFELLLLGAVVLAFNHHELIIYGLSQANGQVSIVLNAKPIAQAVKDKKLPDSLKTKLLLVQEIKQFAVDSLGIHHSDNYNSFYDQQNKPALWVITASDPFQLKPVEWNFPIIGDVSYKGFFNKDKAKTEYAFWRKNGYDVDMGGVSGWSTLGWFEDPILSNMLKNSEGELANLIIHELTHSTVFLKNNVNFNENLANFIGHKGAIRFLKFKYGKDSEEYKNYLASTADEKLITDYILQSAEKLDSLYHTFTAEDTYAFKLKQKNSLLVGIVKGLYDLPLSNVKSKERIGKKIFKSANAYFMSFRRYDSKQEKFEKEYRDFFNSDVKQYLSNLKKHPSL